MHFNPRSHERSDVRYSVFIGPSVISIHAPTRGATAKCQLRQRNKGISIHAPTRGATTFPAGETYAEVISIHAPTRGATVNTVIGGLNKLFQSTLPREERLDSDLTGTKPDNFNPRSHERSDMATTDFGRETTAFQSTLPREERRGMQCKA